MDEDMIIGEPMNSEGERPTAENHPRRRKEDKEGFQRRLEGTKEFRTQGLVAFFVLAAVLLFYYVLKSLPAVATALSRVMRAIAPAIWGFCIAFLLNPIVKFMEKRFYKLGKKRKPKKNETAEQREERLRSRSRGFAILVTMICALSVVTLLIVAIIPQFNASIQMLVDNIPTYTNDLRESLDRLVSKNKAIERVMRPMIDSLIKELNDPLDSKLAVVLQFAGGWVVTGVKAVARFLFNLLIGIIFSIYLMKDKEYLIGIMKKLLFGILPKKTAKITVQTLHKANGIFNTAILGKILDSMIIGMLCFIGTSILGCFFDGIAQYKGLVSIIVGVTNVIPFFGPFIGGIPCALLIFCIRPLHGLVFAAFVLVLQQFDGNYLDPHVVGKRVGLRPVYVLFACMLFSNLWGLVGMLVAVPSFALVYSIVKSYLEVKLAAKNLPTDTLSYMEIPGATLVKNAEMNALINGVDGEAPGADKNDKTMNC